MDLFRLTEEDPAQTHPEGYRFSWIAFDRESPEKRVLFDCHPPKGPHFHLDEDREGVPFEWTSLAAAIEFFRQKVREHFGELDPVPLLPRARD